MSSISNSFSGGLLGESSIYILEIKIDKTAKVALQQIIDKNYAAPFATDPRQLFKIGLNFSTETKLIDDWVIA